MRDQRVSTGAPAFDNLLGGGLEPRVITQLYGGPASGKSVLCILAAVSCLRSGKGVIVYWINVPNTGARVALDILCDIMQNASLPPDDLAKELDVTRREMDMGHDDPGRRSSKRLFETAYTASPYRYPIIGLPDIFNRLLPAGIHAYYRARYAPNNVFFVVVGDVEPEAVIDQVSAAYATAKAQPLPSLFLPEEPPQVAARELIEEAPVEFAHFHLSWHVPELRHPDTPALDVLATLLGAGRSSRLFRQVRAVALVARGAEQRQRLEARARH